MNTLLLSSALTTLPNQLDLFFFLHFSHVMSVVPPRALTKIRIITVLTHANNLCCFFPLSRSHPLQKGNMRLFVHRNHSGLLRTGEAEGVGKYRRPCLPATTVTTRMSLRCAGQLCEPFECSLIVRAKSRASVHS